MQGETSDMAGAARGGQAVGVERQRKESSKRVHGWQEVAASLASSAGS
jgi:hypothetical protein